MRCPNPDCRRVFVVAESGNGPAAPPEPPPAVRQMTGSVGDLVPMLPAESAAPAAPPAEESWQDAPPVRGAAAPPGEPPAAPASPPRRHPPPSVRKTAPAAAKPAPDLTPRPPSPPGKEEQDGPAPPPLAGEGVGGRGPEPPPGPEELPPGAWDAPPVRKPGDTSTAVPAPSAPAEKPATATRPAATGGPPAASRWAKRVVLVLAVVAVVGLGVGIYALVNAARNSEERLAGDARADYKNGLYGQAADLSRRVQERFPDSPNRGEYAMLQQVAELRDKLKNQKDTSAALDDIDKFVQAHGDDPNLKPYAGDLGAELARFVAEFARANQQVGGRAPLILVEQAREVSKRLKDVEGALPEDRKNAIDGQLAAVEKSVREWE